MNRLKRHLSGYGIFQDAMIYFPYEERNGVCLMRILVMSDSHSGLGFMRECIKSLKPNAIIHLGDYYDDGQVIGEENPQIPFYQVPGNCDRYRCPPFAQEILIMPVCGVPLYMTHGHLHQVKMTLSRLILDARASKSAAALYGHTHIPDCHQESDGLWVLNPGSCGSWGGTVGLIETEGSSIKTCKILTLSDLED